MKKKKNINSKKRKNNTTPLPKNAKQIKNKKKVIKKTSLNNKKNSNKKSNKNKYRKIVSIILVIFILITIILFLPSKPIIKKIYISNENKLTINYIIPSINKPSEVYCLFNTSGKVPTINDENWFISENNTCSTTLDDKIYYGYIKINNKITTINKTSKYGKIININFNNNNIYIAPKGTYQSKLNIEKIGYIEHIINWKVSDSSIASIDQNGIIIGKKEGSTTLIATTNNLTVTANIIVTNLITSNIPSNGYDFNKPELECNKYTKEENDLLDEILVNRINEAGYQTRAGVVAAARFLVLEFPYKISYFYENGRGHIDGEGRYYHKGLYLDESRYSSIRGSVTGPKTWGCPLYSYPAKRNIDNGLDCSGYVTWAMFNAGYDPGDIGAGITSKFDLTDVGELHKFTNKLINSNQIKVGDLVHSRHSGGHIGIIIGIDENNYYIAQALWNDASKKLTKRENNIMAVQITKYSFQEISSVFPEVVLMDNYYKKDGNLTNMW